MKMIKTLYESGKIRNKYFVFNANDDNYWLLDKEKILVVFNNEEDVVPFIKEEYGEDIYQENLGILIIKKIAIAFSDYPYYLVTFESEE